MARAGVAIGRGARCHRSSSVEDPTRRCAFTSTLKRAHNTLDIILDELGQGKLPTLKAAALNELLKPFGLAVTPPMVRVEQGIAAVGQP